METISSLADIACLEAQLQERLSKIEPTKRERVLRKLIMAALSSIPWVGGFLAAAQAYKEEEDQLQTDSLQKQWLQEHRAKMQKLAQDLAELINRLSSLGDEIQTRIESEEYLALVRKAFRSWEQADTDQKKAYIVKLISNAGASTLCPDDLVRLFLDWLDRYHEAHFMVIREIYKSPGITRYEMWANIRGEFPREDSSEADLFKMLIGDLSTGHVIRQHRDVTHDGQFLKKRRTRPQPTGVMKSAFDDEAPYELTELGREFVHYVFSDIVKRIEDTA